jgi:hypothetical protein
VIVVGIATDVADIGSGSAKSAPILGNFAQQALTSTDASTTAFVGIGCADFVDGSENLGFLFRRGLATGDVDGAQQDRAGRRDLSLEVVTVLEPGSLSYVARQGDLRGTADPDK